MATYMPERDKPFHEAVKRDGWYVLPSPPPSSSDESKGENCAPLAQSRPQPHQLQLNTPSLLPALRIHPMVSHAARRARSASGGTATAYLSYYLGQSGAANTPFQLSMAVQPNLDSNWTSWQATFDEFKVVRAEIYWLAYFTTVPSSLPANTPNAAIAYEPYGNTAGVASVNQVLQHEKFSLLNVAGGATGSYSVAPQAVQANGGYLHLSSAIPEQDPTTSTVTPLSSAGQWRPTVDTANYFWGAFNGYCAAGGTSAVIRVESFVRMKVQFRWLR